MGQAHIKAILAAVTAADLMAKDARETEDIPVGGSVTGGHVFVDGREVPLASNPVAADAARVRSVLDTIRAAIPQRFQSRYFYRD